MRKARRRCIVQAYNHPFVYLNVRDYLDVDMDGVIGIPLDELVREVVNDLIREQQEAALEVLKCQLENA